MSIEELREQVPASPPDQEVDALSDFQRRQEARLRVVEGWQLQREHLQEQRRGWQQERQMYQQEQARLWHDLRERRHLRGDGERPIQAEQELASMQRDFSDFLDLLRQGFAFTRQTYQERLDALHEQMQLVQQLADPAERREAFQHLLAAYQHLREDLRESKQLLCEQQVGYRHLRLDYQARRQTLVAQKAALLEQQRDRRWQRYQQPRIWEM